MILCIKKNDITSIVDSGIDDGKVLFSIYKTIKGNRKGEEFYERNRHRNGNDKRNGGKRTSEGSLLSGTRGEENSGSIQLVDEKQESNSSTTNRQVGLGLRSNSEKIKDFLD